MAEPDVSPGKWMVMASPSSGGNQTIRLQWLFLLWPYAMSGAIVEIFNVSEWEAVMKSWCYALLGLALCYPVEGWAKTPLAGDIFPNCAKFPGAAGRTLTVDPQGRNGSALPNIAAAMKAAKDGDTIELMTGDYGELTVTGIHQLDFVTIAAAPGQTPRFAKISIGSGRDPASHWRLTGLSVSGFSSGTWPNGAQIHNGLVSINNSDNIIFERNNIASQFGPMTWQSEADAAAANRSLSGGISTNQSSCLSLTDNHLTNIFNGIMSGGDQVGDHGKYLVISGNTIDDFAGDGIDHFAGHVRIDHNRITNGHDICENKCVHMDGIQGWNWNNRPGIVNRDVIIDSNEIIVQTRPLQMPANVLQGITIFNGDWDGVRISNNLIINNTYHGITVYNAKNVMIVNNTAASVDAKHNTWIGFGGKKEDPPGTPYNIVIRNNVAPLIAVSKRDAALGNVVIDHNLVVKNPGDFEDDFVKFEPDKFAYDLHPKKRSDAKGEGSSEGAPTIDIEGSARKSPADIGAYAYREN